MDLFIFKIFFYGYQRYFHFETEDCCSKKPLVKSWLSWLKSDKFSFKNIYSNI